MRPLTGRLSVAVQAAACGTLHRWWLYQFHPVPSAGCLPVPGHAGTEAKVLLRVDTGWVWIAPVTLEQVATHWSYEWRHKVVGRLLCSFNWCELSELLRLQRSHFLFLKSLCDVRRKDHFLWKQCHLVFNRNPTSFVMLRLHLFVSLVLRVLAAAVHHCCFCCCCRCRCFNSQKHLSSSLLQLMRSTTLPGSDSTDTTKTAHLGGTSYQISEFWTLRLNSVQDIC